MQYGRCLIFIDLKVGVEFEMCKVKVPLVFLGTQGFSARKEGRYKCASIIEASHKQNAL
jgi:hypothetical protein